ncbi:putative two-component system hydrogenase maturation factor HypX/HoxX [Chromobacterium alkanivorans]|uniref:hydrogenase maturation protein n=1 Tax=Chromobacterium alkanivorans TaxID=1071719 RepID=UPI002169F9CD|nr:hydrogenase maturation protein [Chromobacterium alkanivorans]MCS3805560.1 putative two-component system hydrogenase maturation factor HypX/HoxX [Chromobacterium alkanivorans]MCS3819899.1 putative two-component system hydrogenase maturation factor HypX/HoxX [Chromobacterium alkanivorans]MCS3874126.1 putative two-component system hydrogenase maturation factor HypX/HoxX [Chromobacterium alkanivorans]
MRSLKIILLSSAFNGLTQRAWLELRQSGHQVSVQLFTNEQEVSANIQQSGANLVICPFLKDRVPETLWRDASRPVVIIHPGIVGDRGASALDWAITLREKRWGVTALQAVEEMDAGPIWSSCEFDMPPETRKSELYNGPVSDAAMYCIRDVVEKFGAGFEPAPLDYGQTHVRGRLQPNMRQSDRTFLWQQPAAEIKRRIDAADGQPGVLTQLAGGDYYVYDAYLDYRAGQPGQLLAVHDDAVLVGAGEHSLWLGALRRKPEAGEETFKQPARHVLAGLLDDVPRLDWSIATHPHCEESYQPIRYREYGRVGELTFEFYNGAMSTEQCRRLSEALRWAKAQDTSVLLVRGGRGSFSNGVHLNVIQAAPEPGLEAWANIQAIDDVCQEMLTARQLVVSGLTGNAGAGGVMLALAADLVFARGGVVLNPHYKTMGLYGSEYWTYSLPRAVGEEQARQLTEACLPLSAREAWRLGMVHDIGPHDPHDFGVWLRQAAGLALNDDRFRLQRARKAEPDLERMERCRQTELLEMRQDMVENRGQFLEKCRNFVLKRKACGTPQRLVADWAQTR